MARPLNLAATPLRLLFLLILLLLGAMLVGFSGNLPSARPAGSHPPGFGQGTAPTVASQPPLGTSGNQSTLVTSPRWIGPPTQVPAFVAPPAASAPVQAVPYQASPAGGQGCTNPPPGRAIAACSNP